MCRVDDVAAIEKVEHQPCDFVYASCIVKEIGDASLASKFYKHTTVEYCAVMRRLTKSEPQFVRIM
jgi:hypothetical protein